MGLSLLGNDSAKKWGALSAQAGQTADSYCRMIRLGRSLYKDLANDKQTDPSKTTAFSRSYKRWATDTYYLYQTWAGLNFPLKAKILGSGVDNEQITNWINVLLAGKEAVDRIDVILGFNKPQVYYVLSQNNLEIRPSGGFLGSYAKIKLRRGKIASISFHDIYEKDGDLPGHVDPPKPIQTAFKHGFWRLRDANWDVDFNKAAADVAWFLTQSKEEAPFGMVAMNLSTIRAILKIIGPVQLPEDGAVVTADNMYQVLHPQIAQEFFPGSKTKSRILSYFGFKAYQKIKKAP
ncbi:MAG: DUF4012 domain-containing protein, partial [bacterium]|nr:DUF4012 domain-containing protein [bacterium]